ncbi:hypothetical protein BLJ79_20050 [Arthrobacter sp. UCD-GKA]|uniref:glycosyltransferase n=1 Tax=Arthrobacter sp. UCD-GKA TaxID=1913576 RepID=UPI0008DE8973|nr:glycosyltransferase [Arthrobacter sp. UCD-GKA]OIH82226.1 hypothetical protein BLJ79_20050 [Arthrobacter sp. UCD-GKA]
MSDVIRRLAIVVPVRNEEALLGGCLRHLQAAMNQVGDARPGLRVGLTLVLDGCRDGSGAIAEAAVARDRRVEVLAVDCGSVGATRAAGVAQALGGPSAAGRSGLAHTWIACTDADTRVPRHWLTGQLELAESGVDVVTGTVEPDRAELGEHLFGLWQQSHVRTEGHGHVHGANLGVRASAYVSVGGFDPVPVHEDALLVHKLRASGARIRATARLHAVTSGRLRGRLEAGFADYLRALDPGVLSHVGRPGP